MKLKYFIIIITVFAFVTQACEKTEADDPVVDEFGIYELIQNPSGSGLIPGNKLTTIPANTTVRIQVFTDSDIGVIWTGDYTYRPIGTSDDQVLNSHAYEHYGQLGAQGWTTASIEGNVGWFKDYKWEAGQYTVTVVLTNHAIDNPEYKQEIFEYPITVE